MNCSFELIIQKRTRHSKGQMHLCMKISLTKTSHTSHLNDQTSHQTGRSPQLGFSPDILLTVEHGLLRVQQSHETQPTCSAPRWARRTTGSPASPSSGTSACRWVRRERRSPASW